MRKRENPSVLSLKNTKNKSYEQLKTHETIYPDRDTNLLVGIVIYISIIGIIIFGSFFLQIATLKTNAKITILFWFCILVIPWTVISGWLWTKLGNYLFQKIVIRRIIKLDKPYPELNRFQKIQSYLLGGPVDHLILQLETEDTDISNIQNLIQTTIKTILLFLAMLFITLRYLSNTMVVLFSMFLDSTEIIYVLTFLINFSLALLALSIYHPFSSYLNDCKVMVISDDGSINYAFSRMMNFINGIFGIPGILSGIYVIDLRIHDFEDLLNQYPDFVIYMLIVSVYILILVITIVLMLPILLPTFYFFYKEYSRDVNKFRMIIQELNVPLGYTMINTTDRLT